MTDEQYADVLCRALRDQSIESDAARAAATMVALDLPRRELKRRSAWRGIAIFFGLYVSTAILAAGCWALPTPAPLGFGLCALGFLWSIVSVFAGAALMPAPDPAPIHIEITGDEEAEMAGERMVCVSDGVNWTKVMTLSEYQQLKASGWVSNT